MAAEQAEQLQQQEEALQAQAQAAQQVIKRVLLAEAQHRRQHTAFGWVYRALCR